MNPSGHRPTLIAKQRGNLNAVRFGVHSKRFIEARAAEIVADSDIADELDEMGKFELWSFASQVAVLEFIDRDLSERGPTDRNGKPRYLLQRRERTVRLMNEAQDRVFQARARARKQKAIDLPDEVVGERADYVRHLQLIALDHDPQARVSDRLTALKLLVDLGAAGTTRYYTPKQDPYLDDPEIGDKVAMLWAELEEARKRAHIEYLRGEIHAARLDC